MILKSQNIFKSLVFDPGFGFAVAGVLLFGAAGGLALALQLICLAVVISFKVLKMTQPPFLHKRAGIAAFVLNDCVSLRIVAMTSFLYAGILLSGGALELWTGAADQEIFINKYLLPALTGSLFAISNILFSFCLSGAWKNNPGASFFSLAFFRPETWTTAGFCSLGLMSGLESIWAFPFVIAAFVIALRNVIRGDADYKGYPRIIYAGALVAFGFVAFANGNILVGIADFIDAFYLCVIEAKSTPGGFGRIAKDMSTVFNAQASTMAQPARIKSVR